MSRQVTLAGEVIRTTDRAVLFRDDGGEEIWVPRSVLEGGDSVEPGDADLVCAEWFAEREGLV